MSKLIRKGTNLYTMDVSIVPQQSAPLSAYEIFTNIGSSTTEDTLKWFAAAGPSYEGQRVSLVGGTSGNYEIKHYTISNNTYKPLINAASCGLITIDEENKKINFNIGDSEKINFGLSGGVFEISSENISSIYSKIDIAVPSGKNQYSIGSTLNNILNTKITGGNGLTGGGDLKSDRSLSVVAGNGIVVNSEGVHHYRPDTIGTSTTSSGRTYINSISFDGFGHVTYIGTRTETNDPNQTIKVGSTTFDTDAEIELKGNGGVNISTESNAIVITGPEAVDGSKLTFSKNLVFTEAFGKYTITYNSGIAETDGLFGGTSNKKYTLKTDGKSLEELLSNAFSKDTAASLTAEIEGSTTSYSTSVEYGTSSVTLKAASSFDSGTTGASIQGNVAYSWSTGGTGTSQSFSNITSSITGTLTATATLSDSKTVTDDINYTITPQKYTYYAITTSTSDPTSWSSFGSTLTTGIKFNNVPAGSYLWIASTTNNRSMYQLNELSGKYNDDSVPTTKSTTTKSLTNAKGVSTSGYYFYRTTNKTSVDSSPTFKLDS